MADTESFLAFGSFGVRETKDEAFARNAVSDGKQTKVSTLDYVTAHEARLRAAAKTFLGGQHRWGKTAAFALPTFASIGVHLRAEFLVHNDERRRAAGKQVLFTRTFYDHLPIYFSTSKGAAAKSRLFRERFAIAYLLAVGPTHTEKLSAIAKDPYAVLCFAESAGAEPDLDLAALRKTHLPLRETLLVAAARSKDHRAELERLLDEILRDLVPDPAAKGGRGKTDPTAHAEAVSTALSQWVAVLPDEDLDLLTKKLRPAAQSLWGADAFVKDLDELIALYE